jgi:hypothetical protein
MRTSHNELLVANHSDIDLRTKDNPRSIINLVPIYISKRIEVIPQDIFEMNEGDLAKQGRVDVIDKRLRHSFWLEYGVAQSKRKTMSMTDVFRGVCSEDYFKKSVTLNSFKLAYILTPPVDYKIALNEMLTLSLDALREILEMPIYDENGKVNPKVAAVKLSAITDVINRERGSTVQRIEMKSQSLNVNVEQQAERTVDDIDLEIKRLEAKLNTPKQIDVSSSKSKS